MVNMKTLIRIVFVIFIANGIDCLGGVCDDCCDCLKIKEYEEINEEGNTAPKSLVNANWCNAKKDLVLKIFKKKDDNVSPSEGNEDKISIKLAENDNSKIEYLHEKEDELKLEDKKYALFEIKTNTNKTVYLYCSDVESSGDYKGIFKDKGHISISVIACDTENVRDVRCMFANCMHLKKLNIRKFNITKVTDMRYMFWRCRKLEKLEFRKDFNTENVTNMEGMFYLCCKLTELDLKNFNTEKVTNMKYMFSSCSSLKDLNIKNFNTSNVTDMTRMFDGCSSLEKLEIKKKFDTTKVTNKSNIFDRCEKLPQKTQNKILGENE